VETVLSSRTKTVVISPDRPFVIIGERINPTGRKKLGAEMAAGDFSRVKTDAVTQVEAGAHVLDVNAGVPGEDEPALLVAAVRAVMEVTDVPICLDSSVIAALEAALPVCPGKTLVNSVTGEDESLERVLPLIKKYNATVIGIANDETGISMDPEVRLAVARKIVHRAQDHGIPPEDVVIDPLCMTVGADHTAGRVLLETIKLIRRELGVNMSIGASNVSFGLPNRPLLNAALLPMAILAGLTAAITNPVEPEIRRAIRAADLLMGHDEYAARWITAYRKEKK
jgi:5-methyltetrahydrofolate--homocysteine methyltransferase